MQLEPLLLERSGNPNSSGEKFYNWSPYVYSANNPLIYLDPNCKVYNYLYLDNSNQVKIVKDAIGTMNKRSPQGNEIYTNQKKDMLNNIHFRNVDLPDQKTQNGVDRNYAAAGPKIDPNYPNHAMYYEVLIDFKAIKEDNLSSEEILEIVTEELIHVKDFIEAEKSGKLKEAVAQTENKKQKNMKKGKLSGKQKKK